MMRSSGRRCPSSWAAWRNPMEAWSLKTIAAVDSPAIEAKQRADLVAMIRERLVDVNAVSRLLLDEAGAAYAKYFVAVGLMNPRKDAGGNVLPSAYDKISEKLGSDLRNFVPAYLATIERLSARINTPLQPGAADTFDFSPNEIPGLFQPMTSWADALTTIDAIVDRLTVLAPSPPVPTMSTVSVPIFSVGSRRELLSMVSASSPTSAAVGRFIFIDTPKAAICAGVATPFMIWSMAHVACPGRRSLRSVKRPKTCGHVGWASGCSGVTLTPKSSHGRGNQRASASD